MDVKESLLNAVDPEGSPADSSSDPLDPNLIEYESNQSSSLGEKPRTLIPYAILLFALSPILVAFHAISVADTVNLFTGHVLCMSLFLLFFICAMYDRVSIATLI